MDIRYDEWLPSPDLKDVVTAYWRVAGDGSRVPSSAVLPDGHVELVLNLGDPVGLAGPAYTGDQPDRVVVGPLSKALRLEYRGPVYTFGIRFHPARGAGFLGQTATALTERLLLLAQVCAPLDRAIARLLVEQLPRGIPPDGPVVAIVDRLTRAEAAPQVAELARDFGLSARQLQRQFLAAVGVPPKRFVRVVRFSRAWQIATMQPPETWASVAVEHGYADQAHMVREFRAFGAEPPARQFSPDWYEVTEMSRVSGPAPGVRNVQDRIRKRKV